MWKIATRSKIVLSIAALVCCAGFSHAQESIDSLKKKFDRYRTTFPQEKLYVRLAQEFYLTGETVWFKIYYVDGVLHHSMDISKVAYVEILDANNQPLLQTKVALKDGEGEGSLFLPASINSGNYHLRAYTQWMRNFSPEFFFHKKISIVNAFRKLEADNGKASQPYSTQFFPEGGNLVYGLKSKVAFQCVDRNGNGIGFSGLILNERNDTIARISPLRFGIGNFTFTPQPGEVYRAVLRDSLQNVQTVSLPVPRPDGYVMEVRDSTADLLLINVSASPATQVGSNIYYVIHARQVISFTGMRSLGSDKTSILVSKKGLSEGISHITIFDGNLRPQCERLYFKPVEKKLTITTRTSQAEFGVRRKVTVDVSALKSDGAVDKASLSIAVVRADSLAGNLSGDIFNYLWLSSDLRGTVETPEYYMNSGPEAAAAADNLMLTQGWRRFAWNDVLENSNSKPRFIPEYRGHLIRGTVTDVQGKPASSVATYLSTPGRNIQLYTSRSNADGEVRYEMKDFWGPRKIVVQTDLSHDTTSQIKIHNPYAEAFATRKLPAFTLNQNMAKNLLTRSVAMQVQDVYHADDATKFSRTAIDSTAFYGKANETYFLDDFTRFPVMEEVMREYVPGVMVRKRKDGFHFLVLDHVRKSLFQDDPLVLLDGMPIFDVDKIMAFDPLKVRKLEVLTSRYFLGPFTFPGVVSYTTYTGDLAGFQLDPRSVLLDYEGLQRQREFYSPPYENQKQRESRMPDRRNLLFWAPKVNLDNEGKQQLEFYTSDLIGNYIIVVEGLTTDGYAGSATGSFAVKQFNN